ncbi:MULTISPECIES: lipopolysaccharide transport periplasmic protein LptA [Photobacterium]|uniref:Lipopolysaccharide export system protein LptA n=1 Tax=Photobacterium ganghwense TaxID=320778 RepID=A0A0J1H3P1_9GAMM|nr:MULTISPECIES: lipopolysaccharide transport periplasmic protein LptA [Photobacterium]KLV06385.1 ABC transporter substrate-binding protein [Photobacterium ganghwense]MBV1840204.1 lipopolysaccharide transport periplasmic protein LptA [Photobacterium ganghwense]PSU06748.1 lipopolysaccharide transport periplasmic protein LptA [Photobacterium ganghwense]QSV14406.1 lipopolysaccharide transport periplasmic protein LptA [Photobacterium ganghwense]
MKLYKLTTLLCLCLSSPSWALSNDTEQPIYINSEKQELDIQKNIVTFTGSVVLRQGSIDIRADRIVVTRPNGQEGKETIDAYGNPATFHQLMDNGKPIDGAAKKMRYETDTEYLRMTDDAVLVQEGSEIQGKMISYKIDEQKLVAESGEKKRVTTILQPNQLNKSKK